MTIAALPEITVRLLGSHTVIATPVDLVKELLDNAIDAKANSVDILVSTNIVDKIQVRDNGQGIRSEDYNSLGRAGHTSKIASFEDLRALGGATLGFRGQALASANNLGTVTITTRTAKNPAAMELELFPSVGGVRSQRRIPAPIGTTVSVVSLYDRLPVRKHAAIKDALKNIAKIKQILHAYALARSHIRLSFRVLGGSNRQAFSYAPRQGAGIQEAVLQIFGIEVTSQCLIRRIRSDAGNEDGEITEDHQTLSIEAVLPKKDADQSRIAKGPFFSVDSRPVSAQRETMKKLLNVFRTQFSEVLRKIYGERTFRDSFICVNIRCSPGSYGPNIEPSKNAVLFADDSQVIRLFERLCEEVYCPRESEEPFAKYGGRQLPRIPQIRTPPISSDSPRREDITTVALDEVPQQLMTLSKQTPLPSSSSPTHKLPERPVPRRRPIPANNARREFAFDMLADPDMSSDEETETIAARNQQQVELQAQNEDEHPMEALNPWTIAKINAPARPTVKPQPLLVKEPQDSGQIQVQSDPAVPHEGFEDLPNLRPFGVSPADIVPHHTTRSGDMPTTRQQYELPGFQHQFDPGIMTSPAIHDTLQPPLRIEANSRQTLPTLRHSTRMEPANRLLNGEIGEVTLDSLVQTRLNPGSHYRDSQRTHETQVQRHINDIPSKSNPPFHKPKRVSNRRRRPPISSQRQVDIHVENWAENHCLTRDPLGSTRPQRTPRVSAPPRLRSGNTENAAIQDRLPSSVLRGDETWLDGDSRKYLMKRQRSEAEYRRRGRQPLKRTQTDRLPLETVPQSQEIHRLVLPLDIESFELRENLANDLRSDRFCNNYCEEIKLSEQMNLDDVMDVEMRLKDLLSAWTEKVLGQKTEVNFSLRKQVKGKMVAAEAIF